jgi:hypothetical protein
VLRRPQHRISALPSRHPRQAPVFSPPFYFSRARPRLRLRRSCPRSVQALTSLYLALVYIVTCSGRPRVRLRITSTRVLVQGVEPGALINVKVAIVCASGSRRSGENRHRRAFFAISDHARNIIVSSSYHPIFSLLVCVL